MDNHFYGILGLQPNCTARKIRDAYLKRSLHLHPDKNCDPQATVQFQHLKQAYETLSDPARRAAYDAAHLRTQSSMREDLRPTRGSASGRGEFSSGPPTGGKVYPGRQDRCAPENKYSPRKKYRPSSGHPPTSERRFHDDGGAQDDEPTTARGTKRGAATGEENKKEAGGEKRKRRKVEGGDEEKIDSDSDSESETETETADEEQETLSSEDRHPGPMRSGGPLSGSDKIYTTYRRNGWRY
ncbi:hypothetical protein B7494_g5683 [Chlorociboria aeruginascens]|nr:hypothetical protein B7494_g5683 [Chlorociboria aeruginascens]